MKKILSILLAMLMAASAFSGCSKEPDEPEEIKNEIVVESLQQSFTAVIYDSGEDAEFWNAVKAEFENANQGVTINMIVTKDAAFEVRDRILAGNSPDFVYLPSYEETGVTEALIKDKALASLTDVETAAPSGAFENNACKPYEDGISYLAPLFFEAEGLLYNKELLSNNGFSVPQTWDDFIKIAEGCKNKKFEFFTYAGAEPDEFVNIFAAAVAPVIGTEETNKLLDCEEETWANENVKTFAEKIGKITKLVVSGSTEDLEELNKDGEKYALCPYPALSGNTVQTVSFSEMYIPVEAKEQELAKKFMMFLYGEKVTGLASEMLGKTSVGTSSVFAAEFAVKSAANATLSDEFCGLVVDIFKSNIKADEFADKMIEYIKEY